VAVTGLASTIAISVGTASACALQSDGTVMCWGDDTYGELGSGSTSDAATCSFGPCSPTPVEVTGISDAIGISVGDGAACALLSGGTVTCWGLDADGELGDAGAGLGDTDGGLGDTDGGLGDTDGGLGDTDGGLGDTVAWPSSSTPVAVSGLSGVTAVSVNALGDTCALLTDATIQCWGKDYARTTPGPDVTGLANATKVSGFCALVYGGTVSCWQPIVGGATTTSAAVETGVMGATGISGSGSTFACASLTSGYLACWGDNSYGQLGNGTTVSSSTPILFE
jgi:alpha-tubulin suppressor-like RCC1 family protein